MRPAEHSAKPVTTSKTGPFATLCSRLYTKGSGAPKTVWNLSRSAGCIRRYLLTLVALSALAGVSLCTSAAAFAEEARPGWEVTGRFGPAELHPGGYGELFLYVFNSGAGSVSGAGPVVVDKLPRGLEAVSETPTGPEASATQESGGCSGRTEVTCQLGGIAPLGVSEKIEIPVRVSSDAVPLVVKVSLWIRCR